MGTSWGHHSFWVPQSLKTHGNPNDFSRFLWTLWGYSQILLGIHLQEDWNTRSWSWPRPPIWRWTSMSKSQTSKTSLRIFGWQGWNARWETARFHITKFWPVDLIQRETMTSTTLQNATPSFFDVFCLLTGVKTHCFRKTSSTCKAS